MSKSLVGGFAEICRIARKDRDFFKCRKQLIGTTIRVNQIFSRYGPWLSVTGVVVLRDVILNGTKIRKGDHLCLHRVILKSLSLN